MKKTIFYCAGFLFLFLIFIPIFWKARRTYYEPRIREAERFCELLVPEIEEARRRDGKYPSTVDPKWFEGRQIPQLIRLNDFYDSRDEVYRFHFRCSVDFWNNVWAYQCGPRQACEWQNYDEN
jgi:hypothetical protein